MRQYYSFLGWSLFGCVLTAYQCSGMPYGGARIGILCLYTVILQVSECILFLFLCLVILGEFMHTPLGDTFDRIDTNAGSLVL